MEFQFQLIDWKEQLNYNQFLIIPARVSTNYLQNPIWLTQPRTEGGYSAPTAENAKRIKYSDINNGPFIFEPVAIETTGLCFTAAG